MKTPTGEYVLLTKITRDGLRQYGMMHETEKIQEMIDYLTELMEKARERASES